VSAVIGVILMVAITVAIAATVYVWAGGFGDAGQAPESASATAKAVSLDDDSQAEWIKITISAGDGPYTNSTVNAQVATSGQSKEAVCDAPATGSPDDCDDYFGDPTSDEWAVGSAKWFPCQNGDRHSVSLSLDGTAVLDRTVRCQQAA